MSTITETFAATSIPLPTVLPAYWSIADLVRHLNVPENRIRVFPAPGTATESDVLHIRDHEDRLFELIDGILVEKAIGAYESELAGIILTFINNFLAGSKSGHAFGADGAMRILSNQTRIPDVSFVSSQRRGKGKLAPIPALVPNLAVEVLSEGNTDKEMDRKLREYFEAGVELVWYVYPESRSARIYTSPTTMTQVDESGVLDGSQVLPGLEISLRELFARAEAE